jgi:4-diphosphocytidyl-2C-methyl-D-erythritol kinase
MRENSALVALMSGSGSTTFALAQNQKVAENLLEKLKGKFGPHLWMTMVKTVSD